MTPPKKPTLPIKHQWFSFIEQLQALPDSDLTPLITTASVSDSIDTISSDLRLDWWVHVGGVLRANMEARLGNDFTHGPVFKIGMRPDPVLKFEVGAWLKARWLKNRGSLQVRVADDKWISELRGVPVEVYEHNSLFEAADWYRRLSLPPLKDRLAAEFLRQMAAALVDTAEPPWILWSRLPPWLKHRGDKGQELFEVDSRLTFLRVALSPQDEVNERASLVLHQLMVNPTFEYVESSRSEGPVLAFARNWDVVLERSITALEAAVLDHVRESFRSDRAETLKSVASDNGVRKEFVNSAIESLISKSFLLGSSTSESGSDSSVRDQ
jgi:hypothetical protein